MTNKTDRTYFQTMLIVEDFLSDECDSDCAFIEASEALDEARDMAIEDLTDLGYEGENYEIISVKFVEFDSSNIGHAGAHFEVELTGIDQEELDTKFEL